MEIAFWLLAQLAVVPQEVSESGAAYFKASLCGGGCELTGTLLGDRLFQLLELE